MLTELYVPLRYKTQLNKQYLQDYCCHMMVTMILSFNMLEMKQFFTTFLTAGTEQSTWTHWVTNYPMNNWKLTNTKQNSFFAHDIFSIVAHDWCRHYIC